jgi:hypothetical protein
MRGTKDTFSGRFWVNVSILGLCTIGLLGLLLRSKIVFSIPFINYNHFVEAHSRFTFSGWVTLALMLLMVSELLPESGNKKKYIILFAGIAITSWAMMIAFLWKGYNVLSIIVSLFFILLTYIYAYVFVKDILKAKLSPGVRWLAVSSMICLVISSFGLFIIDYIYFSHSFEAFLYRDSLFTYLHFQYNGFFSLSIMALLFNNIKSIIPVPAKRSMNNFIAVLLISLIPSLFLSYLWQDPNSLFRIIAIAGSIFVLAACLLFVRTSLLLKSAFNTEKPVIRLLILISMLSFALKLFLQCFTIFPVIGNAIFGNRPFIMGFLHLVFLGFVSLFILAFYTKRGLLDISKRFTKAGLIVFATGVLLNEIFLISQGLMAMFARGGVWFPWLLWGVSIWLFAGSVLIAIARAQTRPVQ